MRVELYHFFENFKLAFGIIMRFLWTHIRKIFLGILILYIAWIFLLKKPVYQRLYGKVDPTLLIVSANDSYQDVSSDEIHTATVAGYEIEIKLVKKYAVTGYVAMIDRYSFIGAWYRSSTLKHARLYDAVSPLDLAVVHGQRADKENIDRCQLAHEYRLFSYNCPFRDVHYNNHHVIPASYNVEKGLEILQPGRVAQLEGYAVYWQGTGDFKHVRFRSAITSGQMSDMISGGSVAGLCTQLYLTKLSFDGYVFE